MHELGIVFHIIRTVEDVAKQNDVTRIRRVTLQLGEVSGVVESYLQDCWKWAAAKTDLLPGAVLTVETIPAVTQCQACGRQYETVRYGRTCPHCQSPDTYLVQGSEMMIKEIEGKFFVGILKSEGTGGGQQFAQGADVQRYQCAGLLPGTAGTSDGCRDDFLDTMAAASQLFGVGAKGVGQQDVRPGGRIIAVDGC